MTSNFKYLVSFLLLLVVLGQWLRPYSFTLYPEGYYKDIKLTDNYPNLLFEFGERYSEKPEGKDYSVLIKDSRFRVKSILYYSNEELQKEMHFIYNICGYKLGTLIIHQKQENYFILTETSGGDKDAFNENELRNDEAYDDVMKNRFYFDDKKECWEFK